MPSRRQTKTRRKAAILTVILTGSSSLLDVQAFVEGLVKLWKFIQEALT